MGTELAEVWHTGTGGNNLSVAALKPLGFVLCSRDDSGAGFGHKDAPAPWLHLDKKASGKGAHLAFRAKDHAAFLFDPDGNNVEAVYTENKRRVRRDRHRERSEVIRSCLLASGLFRRVARNGGVYWRSLGKKERAMASIHKDIAPDAPAGRWSMP